MTKASSAALVRVEPLRRIGQLTMPGLTVAELRRPLSIALMLVAVVGTLVVGPGGPAAGELAAGFTNNLTLVLATVSLLLTAELVVLRPSSGLILWLLVMPLLNVAHFRFDAGVVTLTPATLVIGVGALAVARTQLHAPSVSRGGLAVRVGALAILTIAAASVALANNRQAIEVGLHGVIEPTLLALMVIELRPTIRVVVAIALAGAAGVAIGAGYSLVRQARVVDSLLAAQIHRTDFGHLVYFNVDILGELMAIVGPMLIAAVLVGRRERVLRRPLRWVLFGLAVVCLVSLVLTFSKGAWLGGLAGVTLVLFVAARHWVGRIAVVLASAIVATLIVPIPIVVASGLAMVTGDTVIQTNQGLLGAYQQIFTAVQGTDRADSWDPSTSVGEVSISERFRGWRAATKMMVDHPLTGVGPGQFGAAYAGHYHDPAATRALGAAHNLLLNIGAELGAVFLLIVLLALAAAGLAGIRAWRHGSGLSRVMGLVVLGGLTGVLVVGETTGADLYEPYRVSNTDILFVGLLIALGIALGFAGRKPVVSPDSATVAPG